MQNTISISTGSLYQFGLNRIFKIAHNAGFKSVELMLRPFADNGYLDTWDVEYLKQLEEINRIKIISIHPPIDFETNPNLYFRKVINLTKKLHVKHIVIHIPQNDQTDYIEWFNKFNPERDCKGIDCLFENMGKDAIYQGVREYSEYNSFCYDTAHALKAGDDPKEELSVLNNIKQLHISIFDDGHCHRSIVNSKPLIKKLIALHPNATRCLELCPEAFPDPENEASITNLLRDNRKVIESI